MALKHCFNTWAALQAVDLADCTDGDTATMYFNERDRLMQFVATDTGAENNTRPGLYRLRPHDYVSAGVWVESPGNDYDTVNGGQIIGDIIYSTNWSASAGSMFDLNNGILKMGGSDVNAALSATTGVFIGRDSGVDKFAVGKAYGDADEQSYIIWNGALSMRMAAGETFQLYGSITINDGGDIKLVGNDEIGDKATVIFSENVRMGCDSDSNLGLWNSDNEARFYIGHEPSGGTSYAESAFKAISMSATDLVTMQSDDGSVAYAKIQLASTYSMPSFTIFSLYSNTHGIYLYGVSNGSGEMFKIYRSDAISTHDILTITKDEMTFEGGVLSLLETSTPSADGSYGKIYTKNDNKLYFQDGAGSEHELAFA